MVWAPRSPPARTFVTAAQPSSAAARPGGWSPRAYFWDGGFFAIGRATGTVPPHSHHAFQITIGLSGPVRFSEGDEEWREYGGAVIMADQRHSYDANGQLGVMLFVDPETREGHWLRRSLRETITAITPARLDTLIPPLRAFWEEPLDASGTAELVLATVRGLCAGPPPPYALDERIARAIAIVRQMEAPKIRLEEVADAVFLSPSRFQHLFSDEVGLPFRRYVLWRKLTRSLVEIGRGATMSAAAHASGFADSAHLTRTFHQMFGISPTVMVGTAEFWEIPAPFDLQGR